MSSHLLGALLVLGGYLCGSIPFGVVLSRLVLGVDVRTVGSGNIGATNVARVGGKKLGLLALLLDAAKAVVPILAARALLAGSPGSEEWTLAVALAAFLGHLFPVWLRFRGGKGVATAFGVFLVVAPWAALAGLVAWLAGYLVTRISSVGSLLGTAACVAGAFLTHGLRHPASWTALVIGGLILLRHRGNIGRLLRGEERRLRV